MLSVFSNYIHDHPNRIGLQAVSNHAINNRLLPLTPYQTRHVLIQPTEENGCTIQTLTK